MEDLVKSINEDIKNSFLYCRYLENKKKVENDPALMNLRGKMNEIKNLNCKNHNENLVNEYYDLEKEYYSSVIVKEYQKSKEELLSLLRDISDILSLK